MILRCGLPTNYFWNAYEISNYITNKLHEHRYGVNTSEMASDLFLIYNINKYGNVKLINRNQNGQKDFGDKAMRDIK